MAIKMLEDDGKEKVLGLEWKPKVDKLSFKVKVDLSNIKNEEDQLKFVRPLLTKRTILSRIARIYDPIGFAAAFLIRAKIGIQELWLMDQNWDQDLPEEIRKKWSEFFKELEHLNTVEFPRCGHQCYAFSQTPQEKPLVLVLTFDGRLATATLNADSLLPNPKLRH